MTWLVLIGTRKCDVYALRKRRPLIGSTLLILLDPSNWKARKVACLPGEVFIFQLLHYNRMFYGNRRCVSMQRNWICGPRRPYLPHFSHTRNLSVCLCHWFMVAACVISLLPLTTPATSLLALFSLSILLLVPLKTIPRGLVGGRVCVSLSAPNVSSSGLFYPSSAPGLALGRWKRCLPPAP